MSNTISPNMGLIIPTVGSEPGPTWALDQNASASILDGHNHTLGQGVPIPPAGLNINTDLSFQLNNAILLRSTRFSPQSATLTNSTDVGCVYVVGNELYYNDVTGGNKVRMTNNGSVNSGAGSISGLPSGTASASYASGTFTWQSATSTPANMDFASAILRNNMANSKGVTLSAPSALANNYSLTLPLIPASNLPMALDTSGNMGTRQIVTADVTPLNITRPLLAAVGQQISSSSGSFSTTNTSFTPVTNLSVTITTSGRPVFICLQNDVTNASGAGSASVANDGTSTTTSISGAFQFYRGSTGLGVSLISLINSVGAGVLLVSNPPGVFFQFDTPAAGTYTYTFQVSGIAPSGGHCIVGVTGCVLLAYEL